MSEPKAYDRDLLDRFYTVDELASAIVQRAAVLVPWRQEGVRALEPSSGHGAFLRAMRYHANPAHLHAVDIDPEAQAYAEGKKDAQASARNPRAAFFLGDFVGDSARPMVTLGSRYDLICGNPPFSRPMRDQLGNVVTSPKTGKPRMEPIARAHVARMLALLDHDGGVCSVLLRASFLATSDRKELFRACPPRYVDHVVERPSFTEGGTDNHEYCVITWQRISERRWLTGPEGPTTRWLTWQP